MRIFQNLKSIFMGLHRKNTIPETLLEEEVIGRSMPGKVFVLGDSRTGTMTVHKFLKQAGFNSIHYFFEESGVSNPAHADLEKNWEKLHKFIDEGGYDAFSDYPLRTFYRELFLAYPNELYILTTRRDVETWRRSMEAFFSKFKIELDLDALTNSYLQINEDILRIAAQAGARLCVVCIDEDAEENGAALSEFLGLSEKLSLGWENRTEAYDNSLWSRRITLFNTESPDFLSYVKRVTQPSKAMLSEYGWVYLVNDGSDFLDYLFGFSEWSAEAHNKAVATLGQRHATLANAGVKYLKFIIPEKPVIYPQYLPRIFEGATISDHRPATNLADGCPEFVSYPAAVLRDAGSYGHVFFRGDTHVNWLGAFFLYQHIIQKLNAALENSDKLCRSPHGLSEFEARLASYAGDVFVQLDKEMLGHFEGAWRPLKISTQKTNRLEYLVSYTLLPEHRQAKRNDVQENYLKLLGDRETFRYSHPDRRLPRAVIFRDSTADHLVELLANHFSESLFIWHKGHVYSDIIEREKPDVVLHLMAERFVVQYRDFPEFRMLGL